MIVSMDKKYTLDGEDFTVLTVTKPGDYPVVGHTPTGALYQFLSGGGSTCVGVNLIEVSPYADFVIDEPVMVRDDYLHEWLPRHFAGSNKFLKATSWSIGGTSWSAKDSTRSTWNQCRRPTKEELAK